MKPKYKVGDVVYVADYEYLNQKFGRYHHKSWEKISTLKVKVIRTVVKSVLGWKKQVGHPGNMGSNPIGDATLTTNRVRFV